jgi:hypothetical protein
MAASSWPNLRELLRQILDRGLHLRDFHWVTAAFAAVTLGMENVQHRRRCLSLVQLWPRPPDVSQQHARRGINSTDGAEGGKDQRPAPAARP